LAYFRFSIFDFLLAVVVLLATARRHWRTSTHGPRVRSLAGVWRILGTRERTVGVFSRRRLVVFVRLAFSSVRLCRVVEFEARRAESIAFVIELVNVVRRRVIESRCRRSPFVVVFRENERATQKRRKRICASK
jgi:hypothetical protein